MPSVEVVQELQEAPVKKKSRERRVYVDPFQVGRRISIMSGQDLSDAHIKRYCDMKVDKETGVAYPVYETIDLQQEIDARKHDCGFDLMKKLIATGQAIKADFEDDGQHGVDFTGIPDNVHEMAKRADEANQTVSSLLAALGVKDGDVLTQDMVERLLTDKVAEIYKKQQEQNTPEEVTK